jgi:two-component system NtrC family sensor kinase
MEDVKVLCVAEDTNILTELRRLLDDEVYSVTTTESLDDAFTLLQQTDFRVIIADFDRREGNGVELLQRSFKLCPETLRILLASDVDNAVIVDAFNNGQIDKFISKPWKDENLQLAVALALQHRDLRRENTQLSEELLRKNRELMSVNEKLEDLVTARTEALEIRNRVLQISQGILDVLPVAVFGIDPEDMIVSCNEYSRELFTAGIMGPFGQDRHDIFSQELNRLVDSLEGQNKVSGEVVVRSERYRCEAIRLDETLTQGTVVALIPLHS